MKTAILLSLTVSSFSLLAAPPVKSKLRDPKVWECDLAGKWKMSLREPKLNGVSFGLVKAEKQPSREKVIFQLELSGKWDVAGTPPAGVECNYAVNQEKHPRVHFLFLEPMTKVVQENGVDRLRTFNALEPRPYFTLLEVDGSKIYLAEDADAKPEKRETSILEKIEN